MMKRRIHFQKNSKSKDLHILKECLYKRTTLSLRSRRKIRKIYKRFVKTGCVDYFIDFSRIIINSTFENCFINGSIRDELFKLSGEEFQSKRNLTMNCCDEANKKHYAKVDYS